MVESFLLRPLKKGPTWPTENKNIVEFSKIVSRMHIKSHLPIPSRSRDREDRREPLNFEPELP